MLARRLSPLGWLWLRRRWLWLWHARYGMLSHLPRNESRALPLQGAEELGQSLFGSAPAPLQLGQFLCEPRLARLDAAQRYREELHCLREAAARRVRQGLRRLKRTLAQLALGVTCEDVARLDLKLRLAKPLLDS